MFHNAPLMPHILPFGATEAAIKVNSQVRPAYFTKLAISLNCQLVCFISDRALGMGKMNTCPKTWTLIHITTLAKTQL